MQGPIPAAPLARPAGASALLSSLHFTAAVVSHSESPTWRKQTGSFFALSKKQLLGLVWLSGTQVGISGMFSGLQDTATYCIHNRGGGRAQAVSLPFIEKAYSSEAQTPSPARLLLMFLPDLTSAPPRLPGKLGKSTLRLSILADSKNSYGRCHVSPQQCLCRMEAHPLPSLPSRPPSFPLRLLWRGLSRTPQLSHLCARHKPASSRTQWGGHVAPCLRT